MKGLVVWGNHFCRSFGDPTAAISLLVTVLGVIVLPDARSSEIFGMMAGYSESPARLMSYGGHIRFRRWVA